MTRWLDDRIVAHLRSLPGTVMPERYELREPIGRGGMGVVFRAVDRELGREVALKVLHGHAPGLADRLLLESRILARLEHPGIVPVHDVGTLPDGRPFYVMKLVRGERLDRHVSGDGEGTLERRLRLFERLCDAIAFAHAHGIVHRDLKPENVMIGAFGEVLVLDWGVAHLRDLVSEEGAVLGTPGYMAPEQAAGATVDERADVYALGGILAYLVCGSPRVDGAAGVPRPLAAIARRARADSPAARYASVADLSADVMRYAAGLPVAAYRETPLERLRRVVIRHRTPILLVLAYLLVRILVLLL